MPLPALQTLLYQVEDGIATVTLNRPEKMNAFTPLMRDELLAVFDETDADDAVRVVIITGAGRAFCAGADLSSGGKTFDYERGANAARDKYLVNDVYRDGGGVDTLRIFNSLKPVIGAINGAAVGIGVTLQLPMDIRMASTDARFGFVFARRGITPEAASTWFLSRLVGMQAALEWCFTGRVFNAQEALDRGLVRSLHAPDELLPAARALAREIADNTAPVGGADAPNDVAHVGCRSPHAGAPRGQPRHPVARAIGRCARGHWRLSGKARAGVPQQGVHRHARVLPLVGRAGIQVKR